MNQLSEGQLQQHVTVLGWLHIVGNGIMLLLDSAADYFSS
jgi:hypothetical protein